MKIPNITSGHICLTAILSFCFCIICLTPMQQYDSWVYIKWGEIIVNSLKILDKDLFTFTCPDMPFVNSHWLSQVIYYTLYNTGNVKLLIFAHAVIFTIAYWFIFQTSYLISKCMKTASFVTLLALVISAPNISIRPQAFSILFFSVALYLINTQRLKLLPLLFLIWANTHSAFTIGLLLLGVNFIGGLDFTKKIFPLSSHSSKLLSALTLSVLATLINPWGYKIYLTVISAQSGSSNFITEWVSTSIHNTQDISFFISLFAIIILINFKVIKITYLELLTFCIFTLLGLSWTRATIWWALATTPIFTGIFKQLVSKQMKKSEEENHKAINFVIVLIFICISIACLPWFNKSSLIPGNTPVKMANFLKDIKTSHNIFSNYSWGSYFIWSLRDDQKIFLTPNIAIYPKKVINDYFLVSNGHGSWEEILDKYHADTLALDKEDQSLLINLVKKSQRWRKVYEDELGFIFTSTSDNYPAIYKN